MRRRNCTKLAELLLLLLVIGCRTTASVYVWHPQNYDVADARVIAFAPILAEGNIAERIERAMLVQRPGARADFHLVTSTQLSSASQVVPATFASSSVALQAARGMDTDVMLVGQVLKTNVAPFVNSSSMSLVPPTGTTNQSADKKVAMFWRLIDASSGNALGSQALSIDTKRADQDYPDLIYQYPDPEERLLMAAARESWKSLAPFIVKEPIELAQPWLLPGSRQVRKGNTLAKQGRWAQAEWEWSEAARKHRWNNAAQLNYAIGLAAKEEFAGALQQLGKLGPIGWKDRQAETLFWLDQRHRWYRTAHRLSPPENGWAFPDPIAAGANVKPAHDIPGPAEQPWWTVIPGTKPPGWTWRAWLTQPWVF